MRKHSKLINEGVFEKLTKRFPKHAPALASLKDADPTNGNLSYFRWQATRVIKDNEPVEEVIALTTQFHSDLQRLPKKNINDYPTLGELRGAIEELGRSNSISRKEVKKEAAYIYDDGRFLVLRPRTTRASCHYGRGTKWCISATQSQNYFNSYSSRNIYFYFIIDRMRPDDTDFSKIAVLYQKSPRSSSDTTVYYDAKDRTTPENTIAKEVGEKDFKLIIDAIKADAEALDDALVFKIKTSNDHKFLQNTWKKFSSEDNPVDIALMLCDNSETPLAVLEEIALHKTILWPDNPGEVAPFHKIFREFKKEVLFRFIEEGPPATSTQSYVALCKGNLLSESEEISLLVKNSNDLDVIAIIARWTTNQQIIQKLMSLNKPAINEALADNNNLISEDLTKLPIDALNATQMHRLLSETTDEELLWKYADPARFVAARYEWGQPVLTQTFVASNPNISYDLQLYIINNIISARQARRRRVSVWFSTIKPKIALLRNPALDDRITKELIKDKDTSVRHTALWKLKDKKKSRRLSLSDRSSLVIAGALERTKSPQVLGRFATDERATVRAAVAANSFTSRTALKKIIKSGSHSVLAAVARNPKLSPELQMLLLKRLEEGSSRGRTVALITFLYWQPSLSPSAIKWFATHKSYHVRAELVLRGTRHLTASQLVNFALADSSPSVRGQALQQRYNGSKNVLRVAVAREKSVTAFRGMLWSPDMTLPLLKKLQKKHGHRKELAQMLAYREEDFRAAGHE